MGKSKPTTRTLKKKHTSCKELLGYDISTPEGNKIITEKNFHDTLCSKFIKDAIEIVEKILTNN